MAAHALVIEVYLPGGRFHGKRRVDTERRAGGTTEKEEWPPSPYRLFQALVAGAYGGRWAAEDPQTKDEAFRWFERLDAPIIVTPRAQALSPVNYFVPNNDLDAVGGDPDRLAELRVSKTLRTVLFDDEQPICYAWPFDDEVDQAAAMAALVERLHTFGHGIDQAFARGAVVDAARLQGRFDRQVGSIFRPSAAPAGAGGIPCPVAGTLDSLKDRHLRSGSRLSEVRSGKTVTIEFRQPPKAQRRTVAYDRAAAQLVFELRDAHRPTEFRAALQTTVSIVVKAVRDIAFNRLASAFPERRAEIDSAVCGRARPAPPTCTRVRIVALPSIGLAYTSPSIRRVLVQVPAECPLALADIRWALAGQVFGGQANADGVITGNMLLVPVEADRMVSRYAGRSRIWRSVTPVVLPEPVTADKVDGSGRATAHVHAAAAVVQAMRHADVEARVVDVRIQPEPFRERGLHARSFGADRFGSARLSHVEIRLDRAVAGPMVLGDGRWLGLGLMAPEREQSCEHHVFEIRGPGPLASRSLEASRRLRRAVMSRVQRSLGGGEVLPLFFSGHQPDGAPAAGGGHRHLFFVADDDNRDGHLDRFVVVAPRHAPNDHPRVQREQRRHLKVLAAALDGFTELRAGIDGVLQLRAVATPDEDGLLGRSCSWVSRTPYRPTRQPKRNPLEAISEDVCMECARHGLPRPKSVEVGSVATGPRGRVSAWVRLRFELPVEGPLLLGEGAHFGRSLFQVEQLPDSSVPAAFEN